MDVQTYQFKSQIPSTKLQINLKFQAPMTKTVSGGSLIAKSSWLNGLKEPCLEFEYWGLFEICDLRFGI
jgi:hypothetical protein